MIRRVHIKDYKSLRDADIELQPLTVLFGPNGAGKSNFLDALQLLSRLATARTLKEAFAPPYRGKPLESFSFGPGGIPELLKRESVSFSIEADIEISDQVVKSVNDRIREMRKGGADGGSQLAKVHEKRLRYRVEIEILPASGILRVADEYLAALNSKGEPTGKRNPFISAVGERIHLRMEGQAHPTYYERRLDHTILSEPHYAPHHPHVVALQAELANCHFFYFEPRERMREANPVKEARHIGLMGEDLAAYLNTLKALDERHFRAVEKALRMIVPSAAGIELSISPLGEVELGLREGDTVVPARVLSEGTLRILGLLALGGAKESPTVVGFEEPENGIHPRRVALIAQLLQSRATSAQIVVTTHSPALVDLLPLKSLFACRRDAGSTKIVSLRTSGPLFEEAERSEAQRALDDEEGASTVGARIMRGDFDA